MNEQFNLNVGSRFTHITADIGKFENPQTGLPDQLNNNWDNLSNSLRGIYKRDDKLNIFAGLSQGFRAPNFSDLSRLDSARSSEIETPSPDLNPEKFLTYELGSRLSDENLSFGISVFYTDIRDMIVRTPTGRLIEDEFEVIKKNGSQGYVYGLELDASYQINDRLNAFGGLAFNDGMADTFRLIVVITQ